jgi:threonine aldolase
LLATVRDDVHQVQPAALSITNATEYGLVYTPDETAALGELCRARGLGFHVDGARFANAVASLGCTPAELSWKAGVDALSFGFTKNGGLSAEVLILFRTELAAATHYRRKRGGHLLSKGRYLAAPDPGDARGRRLAAQRPRRQSAAARLAARGRRRAAAAAGPGERDVHPGQRRRGGARCARRASTSTTGAGRSAAGDELGQRSRRVDALAAAISAL